MATQESSQTGDHAEDSVPRSDDMNNRDSSEDTTEKQSADIRNNKKEEGTVYPSCIRLYFVPFAAGLSIFLVSLDTTIVSTAFPRITNQFGSVDDIGWSVLHLP